MSVWRLAEVFLWPVVTAAPAALALALLRPPVSAPPLAPVQGLVPDAPRPHGRQPDSLAAAVVARDVFRLDRRPAPTRFHEDVVEDGQPAEPQAARPVLALVGIVAGAEPSAIVEGLPGTEGARVVRVGERIGELVVKRIRSGMVEIAGMDTVWVLRVREPWNDRP